MKICDICKKEVVGQFSNVFIRQEGRTYVLNGHEECISKYTLQSTTTPITTDTSKVKMFISPPVTFKPVIEYREGNQICRIPTEHTPPPIGGNYPPKPNIPDRVIDDWFENDIGLICRMLSPNVLKHMVNYPYYEDKVKPDK